MRQVCGDKAIHSANGRSSVQQRRTTRKCSGNTRRITPDTKRKGEESTRDGAKGEQSYSPPDVITTISSCGSRNAQCQTRAAGDTRATWCRRGAASLLGLIVHNGAAHLAGGALLQSTAGRDDVFHECPSM